MLHLHEGPDQGHTSDRTDKRREKSPAPIGDRSWDLSLWCATAGAIITAPILESKSINRGLVQKPVNDLDQLVYYWDYHPTTTWTDLDGGSIYFSIERPFLCSWLNRWRLFSKLTGSFNKLSSSVLFEEKVSLAIFHQMTRQSTKRLKVAARELSCH